MDELPESTVSFLFTDVEGSTRLWQEQPQAMAAAVALHERLLGEAIAACGGQVFKRVGDAMCAAFPTARMALEAAVEGQRRLLEADWGDGPVLRVRVAVHTGEAEARDGDYYGLALSRVARVLAAGHGGQILLSQVAYDLVRDDLPAGVTLADLGSHRLKDLQRPECIFQVEHPALPTDFPPLRTLEAHPHNLPVQRTSFVGREGELAEIKRLLDTTHLLTLTGSGGCGKTRLALQAAAEVVEDYRDGVWLVELATLSDPALVPQRLAAALHLTPSPQQDPLDSVRVYLRDKSLLLVVDNCEHVVENAAAVVDALLGASPGLRIIATSRMPLRVAGEQSLRVPSLSLPPRERPGHAETAASLSQYDAVQLFIDRALAVQPTFRVTNENAPALAQLCCHLDGIPLAVELAAARLSALSVDQIAARLGDRFRLLTSGSRAVLPRQQTLRALVDWSYDLLNESEQTLLRRLAVFAGPWTLEAAEEVCASASVEAGDILDLLAWLVDSSLVQVLAEGRESRYWMPETLRQYTIEKLVGAGETEALRDRHYAHFNAVAERSFGYWAMTMADAQAGPSPVLPQAADLSDFRVALAHGGKTLTPGALVMAFALRDESVEECLAWTRRLLSAAGEAPAQLRAEAYYALGGAAQRPEEKRAAWETAVEIYRQVGDSARLTVTLQVLTIAAMMAGDEEAARRFSGDCVSEARRCGGALTLACALQAQVDIPMLNDDPAAARPLVEELLALCHREKLVHQLASAYLQFARISYLAGDYAPAQAAGEECVARLRALGYLHPHFALRILGDIMRAQGRCAEARACYAESMIDLWESGRTGIYANLMVRLGALLIAEGQVAAGLELVAQAERLREALGLSRAQLELHESTPALAAAREALGEEAFPAAYAEGLSLDLEEALRRCREALEERTDGDAVLCSPLS